MERYSEKISSIPDMPPSVPVLGEGRGIQYHPYCSGNGSQGAWKNRYYRVLYRWNLCGSQKRGLEIGNTKRGKGSKIMAITDRAGLPLAVSVTSASPHEVTLVETTIQRLWIDETPLRLIGDKAYDSDALDEQLRKNYSIELIAPHRTNRRKAPSQDGRALRRYCRRWRVERLFAWLYNFRRLVVRYEFHVANYLSMVMLGCIIILLRQF